MRLIDVDALDLEREVELADDWKTAHEIANVVKYAPTVDAVPLDKLCEWLANNALPAPCYYVEGYCPYENFRACEKNELPSVKDCWKIVISKWMGELDAAESMVQKT